MTKLNHGFNLAACFILMLAAQYSAAEDGGCRRYAPYSYDAVSIRPMSSSDLRGSWKRLGGQGFISEGFPVIGMISAAYDVPPNRILSLPSWAANTRYAVTAKMDNDNDTVVSPSDRALGSLYQLRLRSLLCQRFAFRAHAEQRELRAYKLVLDGTQFKLTESTAETSSAERGEHRLKLTGATMQMIATALSNLIREPVVDETNKTGKFDFVLNLGGESSEGGDDELGGMLAGLREDGLKLTPSKVPLEVLLVDSISPPSPN